MSEEKSLETRVAELETQLAALQKTVDEIADAMIQNNQ